MVRLHPLTFQEIILLLSPGFPLVQLLPLFLLVSPFLLMHAESVSSMVRLVVLPSPKVSDSLKIKNTSFLCLFFQPLVKEKKKLLFGSFVGAALWCNNAFRNFSGAAHLCSKTRTDPLWKQQPRITPKHKLILFEDSSPLFSSLWKSQPHPSKHGLITPILSENHSLTRSFLPSIVCLFSFSFLFLPL